MLLLSNLQQCGVMRPVPPGGRKQGGKKERKRKITYGVWGREKGSSLVRNTIYTHIKR